MKYPRKVYVIYPLDENGEIIGAYVGSSFDVEYRIKSHLYEVGTDSLPELHKAMKENGFRFETFNDIHNTDENHFEYDWMDFYIKNGIKVFNSQMGSGNCERLETSYGRPVWLGKGVVWEFTKEVMTRDEYIKLVHTEGRIRVATS